MTVESDFASVVARALDLGGAKILSDQGAFKATLSDLADPDSDEMCVTGFFCDQRFLSFFSAAAASDDPRDLRNAASQAATYASKSRFADESRVLPIAMDIAHGVWVHSHPGTSWSRDGVGSPDDAGAGTAIKPKPQARRQPGTEVADGIESWQRSGSAFIPLTKVFAVLYTDGELVFQEGESPEPGRSVLHAAYTDEGRDWWWAEKQDSGSKKTAGGWQKYIRVVSSRCPIVVPDDLSGIFRSCSKLENISGLQWWDVSSVEKLDGAFWGCKALVDVSPLAGWDVSRVKSMAGMFGDCKRLVTLAPLGSWRASSLADLDAVFNGCQSIKDVSALANWDVSHVKRMDQLFLGCGKLGQLNAIYGWDVRSNCSMRDALDGCSGEPPSWYGSGRKDEGDEKKKQAEKNEGGNDAWCRLAALVILAIIVAAVLMRALGLESALILLRVIAVVTLILIFV